MKSVYMYAVAAATAIAVLVVGFALLHQSNGRASVEKNVQYSQVGLNQNPTQKVQNTPPPNTSNNNRTNKNGSDEGDGD